jgi:hypothetical protein
MITTGLFGGDPVKEQQLRGTYGSWTDGPDPEVGVFTGALSAPFVGIKHGMDTAAAALADVSMPVLEKITPDAVGEWLNGQRRKAYQSMSDTRPDPSTMGIVAQIEHSVGSVLTMGAMGGAVGGVPGAAAAIGGLSGYDKYKELRDQNIDESTAAKVAGVTGAVMGAGALLPAFMGQTIARQIASGVGLNVGLGMVERSGSGAILEDQYPAMASHYKTLDTSAIMIDAVLGAAFPLGARAMRKAPRDTPTIAETDTALTANRGVVEQVRDPAIHSTFEGVDAKRAADDEVARQIIEEGRGLGDVDVPRGTMNDALPNAAVTDVSFAAAKAIEDLIVRDGGMSLRTIEQDISTLAKAFAKGADDTIQIKSDAGVALRDQVVEGKPPAATEVTPESFTSNTAKGIVESNPTLKVQDAEGKTVNAKDVLAKADAEFEQANREVSLYKIAAACAIGVGE